MHQASRTFLGWIVAAGTLVGAFTREAGAQNSLNFSLYRGFTHGGDGTPFSDPICSGIVTLSEHRFAFSDGLTHEPWMSWASLCPEMAAHGNNHFGARFWGEVFAPSTRSWYFDLASDDGSSVLIDGSLVMALPGDHPDQSTNAWVPLSAGWHAYEVNYYEWEGGANLYAGWHKDDTGELVVRAAVPGVVPEPASILLVASGLGVLYGVRFRRRR